MAIELRPYQVEAINRIKTVFRTKDNFLLQASTGSGKTIIFANLIKDYLELYGNKGFKVLVLAHRAILVEQACEKLLNVWPQAWWLMGKACATVGKIDYTQKSVIIGSPQTLAGREIDQDIWLTIVDEVHKLQPRTVESQYKQVIDRLRERYPKMRLLGVTATPYRFHYGNIYGKDDSWFSELDYEISMRDLVDLNYLVDLRIKIASDREIVDDLSHANTQGGEFVTKDLSDLMCKSVHISSIVDAYKQYGENRQYVCVFTVTIEHAELVTEALKNAGYQAAYIHSQMSKFDRQKVLTDFENGKLQFITSVGVLTEGWDAPKIELIIMARPTLSAGLYIQMIGRGTRLAANKENLLILDLVNNYKLHGNPKVPVIKDYTRPEYDSGPQPLICPKCRMVVRDNKGSIERYETVICLNCGYAFEKRASRDELVDRPLNNMVEVGQYYKARVKSWQMLPYNSLKGNYMIKLIITHDKGEPINVFLDIEGNASDYGLQKARKWWKRYSCRGAPPENVDDALARQDELIIPENIDIKKDGKWWKIKAW